MDSKYKPVSQSDSEKGASQNLSPRAKGRGWNRWVVPMLFHGLVFVVYTAILYRYINKVTSIEACVKRFSSWSPALPAVEYESVTFEGQIAAKNKYRGTPTLELDKAWLHISMNAPGVRLFEKDFEAMGKSVSDKSYHRIPKENGGGYLGMTEVFHLLHCLDSIRRATYPEYYPERLKENQFGLRIHDDHCIDIIRQRLMCTGDVGPIPFYDDTSNPAQQLPLPDFSTTHQCRNFEKLLDWSHNNDRALQWDEVGDLNLTHSHQ